MSQVRIPAHVDDPLMVLFWSTKEANLFIIGTFIGYLLGSLGIGMAIGLSLIMLYRKFEDGSLEGAGQATFYWFGFPMYAGAPDSFKRVWG
jgi:type IV conjugative transfer system protein TraL